MKKIYCGGRFSFDYLNPAYLELAKKDYRARLLGSEELLLKKANSAQICDGVEYIGPFYFESDGMVDEEIVAAERAMIERCTDAVFLLDDGLCPGTIGELILASTLQKNVLIFYVQKGDGEETESGLHTPCWYPILLSKQLDPNVKLYACDSIEQAIEMILKTVKRKGGEKMKTVDMNLNDTPFYQIYHGEKTVELRLYDEKRQGICVGDTLRFTRVNTNDAIETQVTALHVFKSFYELFQTPLFSKCGCGDLTVEESVEAMRKYYTAEQESRYGVVGIEIKVLKK